MVFDKPAGLLSVPGKTGDDLPTRLTRVTGITPYVVHRLDMDTSGLILYAKTDEAQRELSQHSRRAARRRPTARFSWATCASITPKRA